MNVPLDPQPSPLIEAQRQLRIVLEHQQERDPRGSETGTLTRMLVHMQNIEKSVTSSMEDHVNASKRLKDFADSIQRMTDGLSSTPNEKIGDTMRALVTTLREAAIALSNAGAPPSWASAEPNRPVG
jgi:soluble cytochrome b562